MTCIPFKIGNSTGIMCTGGGAYIYPFEGKFYKFDFDKRFGPQRVDWSDRSWKNAVPFNENAEFWIMFDEWFKRKDREDFQAEWVNWKMKPSKKALEELNA